MKKLRKGYTTGTSATGAVKASLIMALTRQSLNSIDIQLPSGDVVNIAITDVNVGDKEASCAIVKDGGDDPDMTTGLHISAAVKLRDEKGYTLTTGEGIGIATLPGLKVAVGEPAINPVPRKMIDDAVLDVLPADIGADIILYVPGGNDVAKKTFNPKLGIIGGISILGTTGIVNPMSEEALMDSMAVELSVLKGRGYDDAVFIFGNYGYGYLKQLGVEDDCIVKISNFVGFMLERAHEIGIKRVLLSGHIGKIVKVAGGIMNTHSHNADCRMEIITAYAGVLGAKTDVLCELMASKTTSAAMEIIDTNELYQIYQMIGDNASAKASGHVHCEVEVGTIVFNDDGKPLYINDVAKNMLKEMGIDE